MCFVPAKRSSPSARKRLFSARRTWSTAFARYAAMCSFSQENARASNSAVKRLEASAQGSRTTRGPCSGQSLRGGPGVQDRAVLTGGVEVTPAAFGLMIVERARGTALGARPADLLVVFEEDVDFAVGSAQLHAFDFPGTFDAQNLAV